MSLEKNNLNNHWAKKTTAYHIFVPSFKDSNGDGIGDLEGIIEKLDYLNDGTEKSLGIKAAWLSPIFESPMADYGYDVSDYYKINPLFGSLEIFKRLLEKAHERNIKIILDLVPNHTSSTHSWFVESRSSRKNPKRDWYVWRDPKPDGSEPNNWLSVFGGSAWELDPASGQYYLHNFLLQQPDLNWRNPEVREEMSKIMDYWLGMGIDGFRIDAVYNLLEDDQFKDDPLNPNYSPSVNDPYDSLLHTNSRRWRPKLFEALNFLCGVSDKHKEKIIVSEAYLDLPQVVEMYSACPNSVHAPFNFNLISLPWNAPAFRKFINSFESSLSPDNLPNHVLGNHDCSRVATRLGQSKSRLAAMLVFSLRGMPFIYYGEELGMEDAIIAKEKIKDGLEARLPGFKFGRDPERTPMQWDAGLYAGFSVKDPWLNINPNYKNINIESESRDPKSMLNLYKTLIHFRNKSAAILEGKYESLNSSSLNIFSFILESAEEKLLIVLNFSSVTSEESYDLGKGALVCSTYMDEGPGKIIDSKFIRLRPDEGYVIKLK